MVEASREHTLQAQELLCSTIIEAALRGIDNCPFGSNTKPKWTPERSLKNFIPKFLGEEWSPSYRE